MGEKKKPINKNKNSALRISAHVKRNAHFLERVARCKRSPTKCVRILADAGPEQLLCLVECCLNLLRGRLPPLRRSQLEKLRPHASQLRSFSGVRSARSARQKLQEMSSSSASTLRGRHKGQQQHGAGLQALIPIVASAILPFVLEQIMERRV